MALDHSKTKFDKEMTFKLNVGDKVLDDKRDLIVLDKYIKICKNKEKKRFYKYKCNKCGYVGNMHEYYLTERKSNCPCCLNRVVVLGINTIWDKAMWMCDLGLDMEFAKEHGASSSDKGKWTCPHCGKIKYLEPNRVNQTKTISCPCSSVGFSYPEKFMVNVFEQMKINYTVQLSKSEFEWCGEKRYDFYVPSFNIIIETNGRQHYEEVKRFRRTLEEEQENDEYKKELALLNNISKYITIDCRYSEAEWIKENILNSELSIIFDLSNIDWLKCEEFAIKSNLVKEVCEYWNNKEHWVTTLDLIKDNPWGIKGSETFVKILKKGTKLGWTNYSPKEEMRKCGARIGKSLAKKVEVYKNGEYLKTFDSLKLLEKVSLSEFGILFTVSGISYFCLHGSKNGTYKGFVFKYV